MTPHKIDRGRQPHKEQETQQAVSQKRRSQPRPRDEADPKKGRTESEGKPGKIQVGIDWSTTGIQKPASKPDSHPPSSKSNISGTNVKSAMAKESQKNASAPWTKTDLSCNPNAQLGDPEKWKIKEKPHRWIEARVRRLDPAGYMEEINSLWCFGRNAGCFALQIVAIADWGWKYRDVGFWFPIPTFPEFLFSPMTNSHQGRAQVPIKLSHLQNPGGDVRLRSREAWKWMVAVLQFWGDEASTADGIIYGGRIRPVSALAEYVLNTLNPGLDSGSKITWDDVVTRTPWMAKRLHGMTAAQELMVRHQALPVPGELEVVLEKRYSKQLLHPKGRGKLIAENPTTLGHKPVTSTPPGLTKIGQGETLKLHLKRAPQGERWSVEMGDSGPSVGCPSQTLPEKNEPRESEETAQPGRSPLTSELLAPDEELTEVLDYEDVAENDLGVPDPEIAKAVAHIPPADAFADVEMQESQPPPGFEPEVIRSGYDVNLVCSNPTELGLASPVTAMENEMLDRVTSRTPGAGRPGSKEVPGHAEDN